MAIRIDDLSAEIVRQLEIFQGATDEALKKATDTVAKKTVEILQQTSPGRGNYAGSWTQDRVKTGRHRYAKVIHAGGGYHVLTHLLEKSHRIVNQYGTFGTTTPQPHIKPAEETAIDEFERELRAQIERAARS